MRGRRSMRISATEALSGRMRSAAFRMRGLALAGVTALLACGGRSVSTPEAVHTATIPFIGSLPAPASVTPADLQARISADFDRGLPVVAHVVVALCDNVNQGIVPVPALIGNGQDLKNNLYWGAAYGVRSFMADKAGWKLVTAIPAPSPGILERIVLHRTIVRDGKRGDLYVVADAWDGKEIKGAIERFLGYAAGHAPERVAINYAGTQRALEAGGSSHLLAYIGHDGLMDFSVTSVAPYPEALPRGSIVLACISKGYFEPHLSRGGSYPLLLTTGLMAPEAYTLDAALRAWFAGSDAAALREAAAAAYHKYQKCGLRAAHRLFVNGS